MAQPVCLPFNFFLLLTNHLFTAAGIIVGESSPTIPDVKDTPESQNLVGERNWHRGEVLVAGKGPAGDVKDYHDMAQFQGH